MNNIFKPKNLTEYSTESIIAEIKRVKSSHFKNKVPTIKEFEKYSMVKHHAIAHHFGSWKNAIEKAGYAFELGRVKIKDIIADLEKAKKTNNKKYFTYKFYKDNGGLYSKTTLKIRFGCHSWRALLKKSLNLDESEDMVNYLKQVKELNRNKFFSMAFYERNRAGKWKAISIMRTLGCDSWRRLLKEKLSLEKPKKVRIIKVRRPQVGKFTEQQLFDEIKRVWDISGKRPMRKEFRRLGKISIYFYYRRFGTWKGALEEFALKRDYDIRGRVRNEAVRKKLLDELASIVSQFPYSVISYRKYKELGGRYSLGVFQLNFGGWNRALKSIGKEAGKGLKYSKEQLFEALQRVWEKLGRQPTSKDLNCDENISIGPFKRKFGSWRKAIHAFCLDRENIAEGPSSFPTERDVKGSVNHKIDKTSDLRRDMENSLNKETFKKVENLKLEEELIVKHTPRAPTLKERLMVFKRDSFKCQICGRSPSTNPGLELEIDHIIPYSKKGGETIIENLRTLCRDCNRGKSDQG